MPLAFTPDGTRLRAVVAYPNKIVEFDGDANLTVILDAGDGLAGPCCRNALAYDAWGTFFVANHFAANIITFAHPALNGPPTVFADQTDGVSGGGARIRNTSALGASNNDGD